MRVPAPRGLSTNSVPSSAATRSPSPGSPRAGERVRPALAVVLDDDDELVAGLAHADSRAARLGVLRDVRQRLGDDVVRSDGDRRVERRVRDVELDGDGCARGDHAERRRRARAR